ncbi:39S ribosomal protein L39, mitochondrial [Schistocerca nitens]|uniref:39S ribosomal protein L39, mitochondrial n=1 Tax=Schistocerca nitens TaxID=7011 RepID=UPI0021186B8F|nr:39S ribosomal protein L39, mitochondrial [Schistocerca nitens]
MILPSAAKIVYQGKNICCSIKLSGTVVRGLACSTEDTAGTRKRRSKLFSDEKKRQKSAVGRIEKIEVQYIGTPADATLVMNKGISTPFNCAEHMSEMLMQRSALALLDDSELWDMHRPLPRSCSLQLLHFQDEDPRHVNRAFWRTCSMALGAVIENAFKEDITVRLHSFPPPNIKSGSFVYDVDLSLSDWQPNQDELRSLSGQMVELAKRAYRIERLSIPADIALEMFADNPHKLQQIPDIASSDPTGDITVYRMGEHVDISRGPLVGNTGFIGRCTVTAVHHVETDSGSLYRFQGVALPRGLMLNHYAYGILESRASKLNTVHLPDSYRAEPAKTAPVMASTVA